MGCATLQQKHNAIAQFVYQRLESFEYNKCTLGVFIDLSKAFNTVDNSILLHKLELLVQRTAMGQEHFSNRR